MKNQNNDVWIGAEERTQEASFTEIARQEFIHQPISDVLTSDEAGSVSTNRRDFLKYLGFGLGAATIAASCEIPVRRAIPYVIKPDAIVPGISNYYASSYVSGGDYAAVLVKTREGRPIKIEGNTMSGVTRGGTSARAQAFVLSLYDTSRLQSAGRVKDAKIENMSWEDLDKEVKSKFNAGSSVRIVTGTVLSPTTKRVLAEFVAKYPNTKIVSYDAVSASALLDANQKCFGDRVIPNYRFDKAMCIVSFDADFLGTWISPVEYAADYSTNRKIDAKELKAAKMSRHIQVESRMSLTGSNADNRILVKPSEQGAAIAVLYNEIAALTGGGAMSAPKLNEKAAASLKKIAKELIENKGKSLVVSASNHTGEQIVVNKINQMLGNYGTTIDFAEASLQRQGSDADFQNFIKDLESGSVNAVFVLDANPAFDAANTDRFKAAFAKASLKVSFSMTMDETTALCDYAAPTHHGLEAWGDAEPKRGHYSLIQPTISKLFSTRQAEQSLLTFCESANLKASDQPYYEYLKDAWQKDMFPRQKAYALFQTFWDSCLHDGVFTVAQAPKNVSFSPAAADEQVGQPANSELEIGFYETIGMGGGQHANNPWLQEMPDPIMRTVWGNYLSVPINWDGINNFDGFKKLNDGDKVEVEINGAKRTCIVVRQFGQMEGTIAIGLGYGRQMVGAAGKNIGTNINAWFSNDADGNTQYSATDVKMTGRTGTDDIFACVQYHHTMGVTGMDKEVNKVVNVDEKALGYKGYQGSLTKRTIIRHGHIDEVEKFVEELQEERKEHQELNSKSLYPGHDYKYTLGHHWNMFVDLNACTGCASCVVACMAENNVPVVGKREVHRHHEMTWLRIDRYYYGDVENPSVVYQPLMCQHCDSAPCENVCPVAATNHSSEGLNQMTYNRCIGTRYCANNCPYKVRRFNWLDYTNADMFAWNENAINGEDKNGLPFYGDNLTRMVLNPDVTVRSRGVIEKCSFCVQRIQEGKLTAKRETRQLRDGDVKTACQTACPTGAITFGDRNNKESLVVQRTASPLVYQVLEEVNIRPNVNYTARIHNRMEEKEVG